MFAESRSSKSLHGRRVAVSHSNVHIGTGRKDCAAVFFVARTLGLCKPHAGEEKKHKKENPKSVTLYE